jgi:peptide/nickel transport system permease protein
VTRRAKIAAGGLLLIAALAVGADLFPYGPTLVRTEHGIEVLRAPSERHWLGTDDRGRDVAARLAHGARTSLVVAAAAMTLALLVGTTAGALAGGGPRIIDKGVVGACDVIGALPALLLVVAAQGLIGRASFPIMVGLIALPRAADVARLARAEVRRALSQPFVEATRAIGASPWRVLWRHALPQAVPQLAVAAAMTLSSAVLSEAMLTFIGFGTPPPTASWGELLREAQGSGLVWWLALPAGAAVAFVALCANVLADELAVGRSARRRLS